MSKPSNGYNWADGTSPNTTTEPTSDKRDVGFFNGETLASAIANGLFRAIGEWLGYLETTTDTHTTEIGDLDTRVTTVEDDAIRPLGSTATTAMTDGVPYYWTPDDERPGHLVGSADVSGTTIDVCSDGEWYYVAYSPAAGDHMVKRFDCRDGTEDAGWSYQADGDILQIATDGLKLITTEDEGSGTYVARIVSLAAGSYDGATDGDSWSLSGQPAALAAKRAPGITSIAAVAVSDTAYFHTFFSSTGTWAAGTEVSFEHGAQIQDICAIPSRDDGTEADFCVGGLYGPGPTGDTYDPVGSNDYGGVILKVRGGVSRIAVIAEDLAGTAFTGVYCCCSDGDRVYVCERLDDGAGPTNQVRAFGGLNNTGELLAPKLWGRTHSTSVELTSCATDGRTVYFASSVDGYVLAFDVATGADRWGWNSDISAIAVFATAWNVAIGRDAADSEDLRILADGYGPRILMNRDPVAGQRPFSQRVIRVS